VLESIAHETKVVLESISGGLCALNFDMIWDFFESLARHQRQSENASESFIYPSPNPYDFVIAVVLFNFN